MPPVRVAVLSDDRLYCDGLRYIVGTDPSFSVVGWDAGAVFRPALRELHPHALLVDSRMAGALGLCAALKADDGPPVILVAAPDDESWALEALSAGARGILTSVARAEDLVKAVRVVVDEGQLWAPRRVLAASIARLTSPMTAKVGEAALGRLLSDRERQVFRHAATGLCNKEIAERLAITEATVKTHLSHIFQKLGLRGRGELAAAYHGVASPLLQERVRSRPLRRPA